MFRRPKRDESASNQSALDVGRDEPQLLGPGGAVAPPDATRASSADGPPAPTLELDRAYDQRAIAHGKAIMALRGRGVQTKARVTGLTLLYECRPDPDFAGFEELVPNSPREWSATAVLETGTGEEVEADCLVYTGLGDPDPQEGGQVNLFYDPVDRSHIYGEVVFEVASRVRWKVPAKCPECGAPVDQSTEALAEHPTCPSCRNPLPCEPY